MTTRREYTTGSESPATRPITLSEYPGTLHLAELKLSYRRTRPEGAEAISREPIDSPDRAVDYLRRLWDPDTLELREEFVLVCMSTSLEASGWIRLHAGGLQGCPVDLRLLFGAALQAASSAILVAHNHPSGRVTPSGEDRALTERLAQACTVFGIRFLDHVILTGEDAYSFRDREPEVFG